MGSDGANINHSLNRLGTAIKADHPVTAHDEPFGHIGAHPA
jgi:hypothetical protein